MKSLRTMGKWAFIVTGSLTAIIGFWGLHNFRLALNGSTSLPENAFLMWAWPKTIWKGAVIAAYPPEAYSAQFQGLYFTKRVVGMPGDVVRHRDNAVCIEATCFPLHMKDGKPFAPPLPAGVIPPGHYAAFGTTADSLDSRYATVGLFDIKNVIAVGVSTNLLPHWKEIKKWADAKGY